MISMWLWTISYKASAGISLKAKNKTTFDVSNTIKMLRSVDKCFALFSIAQFIVEFEEKVTSF